MHRKLLLNLIMAVQCFWMYAADLSGLFPNLQQQEIQTLVKTSELFFYGENSGSIKLFPQTAVGSPLWKQILSIKPNLVVEIASVLPIGTLSAKDQNQTMLLLYNQMRKLSTLSGIQYYSESRKKMHTLFKDYAVIQNMENKIVIADPMVRIIPPYAELFVCHTDTTFGKSYSKLEYWNNRDYLSVGITNTVRLHWNLMPFVEPGNSIIGILIFKQQDCIVLYEITAVQMQSVFGLEKTRKSSFYYRLKAFKEWFAKGIESSQ